MLETATAPSVQETPRLHSITNGIRENVGHLREITMAVRRLTISLGGSWPEEGSDVPEEKMSGEESSLELLNKVSDDFRKQLSELDDLLAKLKVLV